MKVTVIDYGLSNLLSVRHTFAHFGAETLLTSDPADVLAAEKLVLPGVGAFKDGMDGLARLGLIEPIRQKAAAGTPLLGICLGMQMLFDESEEFGLHKGLGLIPGRVIRFRLDGRLQPDGSRFKVPQMGWNRVRQLAHDGAVHPVWAGVPDGAWFYFVHSYHACPADARHAAGETDYGDAFTCAVARDNIFATQFHPEKSADHGLALYRNFLSWKP